MNRKVVSGIMLTLFLIAIFPLMSNIHPVVAQQTVVRVEPLETYAVIDQEFTIAVVVEDVADCRGVEVQLKWDATYLKYVSHTVHTPWNYSQTPVPPSLYAGFLYSPGMLVKDVVDEAGGMPGADPETMAWLVYSSMCPAPSFDGDGTVLTMTFRAKNQKGITTLKFVSVSLADSDGRPIAHTVEDGIVRTEPDTTIVMEPPLVEYDYYAKGEDFTVAVRIEDVEDLYGLDIQIAWNTTWIEYVSHIVKIPVESYPDGVLHSPTVLVKNKVNEGGVPGAFSGTMYWLAATSMSPAEPFYGSGVAFEMTFRIRDYPTYPDPDMGFYIEYISTDLAPSACAFIPHTTQNCHIIFHPFPTPIPTIVPDDYLTIQQAIDASRLGHIVLVRPGIYNESLKINKSVSLVGVDKDTTIISQNYASETISISADNVTVRGFTIEIGIEEPPPVPECIVLLESSSNCEIRDNKLEGYAQGIRIHGGSGNRIMGNDIGWECCYCAWMGIDVSGSSGNIIMRNRVCVCAIGLLLVSSGFNHIYYNVFITSCYPWAHIVLIRSNCNVLEGNTLDDYSAERISRIELRKSSHNSIFHNNFMAGPSAFQDEDSKNNTWDDGYPSGGNYWIDYKGSDNYSGPYQNETSSDGIRDTPRNITGGGQDRYPLMKEYHMRFNDLDIIKIDSDVPGCCVGRPINIIVTVISEDERSKTSNLTISIYNGKQTQTATKYNVTLGSSVTVTLETRNLTAGRYFVKAEVAPVSGETDTADNTLIGNILLIHWAGDVNGDQKVNIYDVVNAAAAYGSKPGDSNWNPYTDLAPPYGIINIYDLVTITYHYGKTYP